MLLSGGNACPDSYIAFQFKLIPFLLKNSFNTFTNNFNNIVYEFSMCIFCINGVIFRDYCVLWISPLSPALWVKRKLLTFISLSLTFILLVFHCLNVKSISTIIHYTADGHLGCFRIFSYNKKIYSRASLVAQW